MWNAKGRRYQNEHVIGSGIWLWQIFGSALSAAHAEQFEPSPTYLVYFDITKQNMPQSIGGKERITRCIQAMAV